MNDRLDILRVCPLVLLMLLSAGCDRGSPTAARVDIMLGDWEATEVVVVPECNLEFSQTLRVEIRRGLGSSDVIGQVTYPGLGGCSLAGHATGPAVEMEDYRCFPFGYHCDGQPVECTGGRHFSVCHIATWSSLLAVFGENTGSGSVRASVAAFDPATGERTATFVTQDSVVFSRSGY